MNPINWSFRQWYALGALLCVSSIAYALYVQHHMLMMPCPLCIFQRVAVISAGSVFLIAAVCNPKTLLWRKICAAFSTLFALTGLAIAARHVAIQLTPADQTPLCNSLGLDYMLGIMPLNEVLLTVFKGSGECAKIDWQLFGLSMPMWTSILFVSFCFIALFPIIKKSN